VGPSLHDVRGGLNGTDRDNVKLADQLAAAWVSFAATGNPNNPKTPDWPAYSLPARSTLVFDSHLSRTVDDPRGPFRIFWEKEEKAS
jgi:para-nitrobenzyl esterase